MWSINATVAWVIIISTALGILFYIGIVAVGTHSYECPFQTPVSIGFRYLRDSATIQRLLTSISPSKVISLIYAIWMKTRQGVILAFHHIHNIMQHPLSWKLSLSLIMSNVHSAATRVGHQMIILLLQIDQAFRNAKLRLVQGIQRVRHGRLLPTATNDIHIQPLAPQDRLQFGISNLEVLKRRNIDNAHCVSWVLHNITDPEAIDSAICLVGTI